MFKILIALLLCAFVLSVKVSSTEGFENHVDLTIKNHQRLLQLRHLAVEFFEYYGNFTSTDLIVPDTRIPNEQDLRCLAEMTQLSQGLKSGSIWALRMIDSWGRLPAGILYGNFKDLGNFDECIRVNKEIAITGHTLKGKYCPAKLLSVQISGNTPGRSVFSIQNAVCFPASCSGQHIDTLLRQFVKQLLGVELNSDQQLIDDKTCQTSENEPFDGLTIFTLVLLGILLGIVLLCTFFDYFFCKDQKHLPGVVQIFSARVNSRSLFRIVDSNSNPNVIDCLHGIRCMSLVWVIYGHDYIVAALAPNINTVDLLPWIKSPYSMLITQGVFSVDSFFFLSGLLVGMVALRTMDKTKGKLNVPLMYLHRFLRLTPVLAVAILVYMKISPLLGKGPLFKSSDINSSTCEDNWFWTLLYVQNYVVPNGICLPHSWYLSVDTQLYVLSPLFLIALYKWGKKGVAGIVVFMLLLSACLFSSMMIKGYSKSDTDKVYFTTHTRAAPWIIGLLFGYYLHVNRGKTFKLNRLAVWLGWIISLGLIFTSLYALYPDTKNANDLPKISEAFFLTLTRIVWPIALSWVVFACKYGYGGMANSFLSSPLWQPLSKLSYCAYIFHLLIEHLNAFGTHTSTYFSDYQVMLRFWYDFGFTILLAYLMYILVEAPTGGIQTLLLPSGRPKTQPSAPIEPKVNEEQPVEAPPLAVKAQVEN